MGSCRCLDLSDKSSLLSESGAWVCQVEKDNLGNKNLCEEFHFVEMSKYSIVDGKMEEILIIMS